MHINLNQLLETINASDAFNHGVWQQLASKKIIPRKLADFLFQMGAFCEASRQQGNLVLAMREMGLTTHAEMVEKILESEAGHGDDFAAMSRSLLDGSKFGDGWYGDFNKKYDQLAPETRLAYGMFELRKLMNPDAVHFNLGVMLVVELAANRRIIPGEVRAFIDSGFYGHYQLDDITYLERHAGENGAEHNHEKDICSVIAMLEWKDYDAVNRGVEQFLECLEVFYDRLDMLIE